MIRRSAFIRWVVLFGIAQAEKRVDRAKKDSRMKKEANVEVEALEKVIAALNLGQPARSVDLTDEEKLSIKAMGFMTLKPP